MQETLKQMSSQVTEKWNNLTQSQKIRIYIGIAACIVAIVAVAFMLRPKMRVLCSDVDAKSAADITNVLTERKIEYKLNPEGTTIEVDEKDYSAARMALAEEDVPKVGYSFSDAMANSMSTTENDKKVKLDEYNRVDLEESLETIENIKSAKVKLVIPQEKNSFLQSKQQSSASVILNLANPLTSKQIEGIARLIASSVQNLDTKNITILDTQGNNLYSGADEQSFSLSKQQEHKQAAEYEIKNKVNELLGAMYSDVRISANLIFDYDQYEEVSESYTPQFEDDPRGIIQSETVSSASSTNTQNGDEPGVANNGGDAPTYQMGDGGTGTTKESNKQVTYVTDKKVATSIKNVGEPDLKASSLAVNLFKNKIYNEEDLEKTLGTMTWKEFKEQNSQQVPLAVDENLIASIQSATGIEQVTVQCYENPIFIDKEEYSIDYKDYLPFILILLVLLLVVVVVMKFRKQEEVVEIEPELEVEEMLKTAKEEVELEEIELKEVLETKRQIDKFVDEKPEAVANLLRNWLTEEEWE
ncbi:flagellar M-ring protein FliF [Sporanaerobium hydrogeniformans]|uniref:Flagellar M-ring protein FliF n=1 Tax=Sporanaerobium hydrogeniformans TaxID=3072179 RepID=A0AC61DEX4_9FIRM|nr:flagellar basal-body MS-ring/collar protein FliF [Sporanaerobium hydrogeniformans]PHV71739.1 flagellar M-ring protein FliF [Sporanaerobium hydrogeniformans]